MYNLIAFYQRNVELWCHAKNFPNDPRITKALACLRHARIQVLSKVQLCQCFFFLFWGREEGAKYHWKRAIIGAPAKRRLNGVWLAAWWWPNIIHWMLAWSLVGFFLGIRTSIARNPIFCHFPRWSGPLVTPTSGSAHVRNCACSSKPSLLDTSTSIKLSYAGLYILRDNHSSIRSHLVGQT